MRISNRIFRWFLLCVQCGAACSKSEEPKVIARVSDIIITREAFRRQFEFNPRLRLIKDDTLAQKLFLGSLIAEKLLTLEARNQGLPETPRGRTFLEQIEREAVIEEFYNSEIANKIKIDEKQLRAAYVQSKRELEIAYVAFKHRDEAIRFRERVLAGDAFENALRHNLRSTENAVFEIDTMMVKWGQATPDIEAALFELKVGEVSEPIPSLFEFYVAKIVAEKREGILTDDDFQANRDNMRKIMLKRQKGAAFLDYFKNMMLGKHTKIPPERLQFLVKSMESTFGIGATATTADRVLNPAPMTELEFLKLRDGLQDHQDDIIVTLDDGSQWTIKEFLQRLSVGRYNLDFGNVHNFRLGVREAILTMVEQEYVYKEGVKKGLQNSPFVKQEVAMWRDNLAAESLLRKLLTPGLANKEEQAEISLSNEQLATLNEVLISLLNKYPVSFDARAFAQTEVTNAGLLVMKTHFPGRLVVPIPLPLENLQLWQAKLAAHLSKKDIEYE